MAPVVRHKSRVCTDQWYTGHLRVRLRAEVKGETMWKPTLRKPQQEKAGGYGGYHESETVTRDLASRSRLASPCSIMCRWVDGLRSQWPC